MNLSIAHGNTEQTLKLTEMLVAEGGKISERQLNKLLAMSRKLGAASGLVTPDILKKSVFPRMSTWTELIVAQLEEAGLDLACHCNHYCVLTIVQSLLCAHYCAITTVYSLL